MTIQLNKTRGNIRIFIVIYIVFIIVRCSNIVHADAANNGKCGDNIYWEFYGGTLEISGNGAMNDYLMIRDYNPPITTAPWLGKK